MVFSGLTSKMPFLALLPLKSSRFLIYVKITGLRYKGASIGNRLSRGDGGHVFPVLNIWSYHLEKGYPFSRWWLHMFNIGKKMAVTTKRPIRAHAIKENQTGAGTLLKSARK